MPYKLGRLAPSYDSRTLHFGDYLNAAALPAIPASRKWSAAVRQPWGVMANDTVGDCTCAGLCHLIQTWTANTGEEFTLTDTQVLNLYHIICGYDPAKPETDQGGTLTQVLTWSRKHLIAGKQRVGAFAAVRPLNHSHVQAAIDLFGGVYIGLGLPVSAGAQIGKVWDVPTGGLHGDGAWGSWGGHCVNVVDYDAEGLTCITWGQPQRMTWRFWDAYCDESYAVLSGTDWAALAGKCPAGAFDFAALEADLKLLAA